MYLTSYWGRKMSNCKIQNYENTSKRPDKKQKKNIMQFKLNEIQLSGYKSIGQEQCIHLNDDITVLVGANGVGKSNLISFFQMLGFAVTKSLQQYIAEHGFANSFLHYGTKRTQSMSAKLKFSDEKSQNEYSFRLSYAAGDTLIYTEEILQFLTHGRPSPFVYTMDVGKKESQIQDTMKPNQPFSKTVGFFYSLLMGCKYFQFHDTSLSARIRNTGYIGDSKYLRSDAGNLAAFLYGLKTRPNGLPHYNRIIRYIQQCFPQFGDFILQPTTQNDQYINLDWREKDSDYTMGAHQLSDGTLRFAALVALLMQPNESLPPIIVLDEPELGLHPSAISMLAGIIKRASAYAQIIIATQSSRLVDEFAAGKIIVVDRDPVTKSSYFTNLDEEKLQEWLKDYTTSELWDKNVIGGRP